MTVMNQGKFGLSLLSDNDPKLISKNGLETFLGHFPAGSSFKSANHFRQMVLAKKFQKYDYGEEKNKEVYGQAVPPEYDMSKIKDIPIALVGGTTDRLASIADFQEMRDTLHQTNSCVFYKEYDFGHLGFLIPPDNLFFYELLELCSMFNTDYVHAPISFEIPEIAWKRQTAQQSV